MSGAIVETKEQWESPEFEPVTDVEIRADEVDIPARNGLGPFGS